MPVTGGYLIIGDTKRDKRPGLISACACRRELS